VDRRCAIISIVTPLKLSAMVAVTFVSVLPIS
jgi:hypothetical protein